VTRAPALPFAAGIALLALLVPPVPAAAGEDAPPAAPAAPDEAPAATVHGRPLPRRAVYEELARRRFRGEDGDRVLEQFLGDAVVRGEQARRGVVVAEEEVTAAIEDARRRMAEQLARRGEKVPGTDPLGRFLEQAGFTLEEFRAHTRHYLAIQRMAREDLGARGEVPNAQVEVWIRDLVRKRGVVSDPAKLGPGELARIGEEVVTLERGGRWLATTVRRPEVLGVALDLAFGLAVDARAEREGIELRPEEVGAEYERLRAEFERQPGIEGTGVTFERWLRDRQGMSADEFRASAPFRARVLARKVLAAAITPGEVRAAWEGNRDAYGVTARIRRIVVHGEDRASVFGAAARPMAEAREIAERALAEIVAGKPFETVARKVSEDAAEEEARGQPLDVTPNPRVTLLPEPILQAVFAAKEGDLLGPLRAVDGWYLVRVERRTAAPAFEECAGRVRDDLVAERVGRWKLDLRADPAFRIADDL
jgi:parvulin-like peptidyl-prolyl isomerase